MNENAIRTIMQERMFAEVFVNTIPQHDTDPASPTYGDQLATFGQYAPFALTRDGKVCTNPDEKEGFCFDRCYSTPTILDEDVTFEFTLYSTKRDLLLYHLFGGTKSKLTLQTDGAGNPLIQTVLPGEEVYVAECPMPCQKVDMATGETQDSFLISIKEVDYSNLLATNLVFTNLDTGNVLAPGIDFIWTVEDFRPAIITIPGGDVEAGHHIQATYQWVPKKSFCFNRGGQQVAKEVNMRISNITHGLTLDQQHECLSIVMPKAEVISELCFEFTQCDDDGDPKGLPVTVRAKKGTEVTYCFEDRRIYS